MALLSVALIRDSLRKVYDMIRGDEVLRQTQGGRGGGRAGGGAARLQAVVQGGQPQGRGGRGGPG